MQDIEQLASLLISRLLSLVSCYKLIIIDADAAADYDLLVYLYCRHITDSSAVILCKLYDISKLA